MLEGYTTKQNSTIEEDGKEKKKRRSFASIAGSQATLLRSVWRTKANPLPLRSPTKRRLSKLHETQRVNPRRS